MGPETVSYNDDEMKFIMIVVACRILRFNAERSKNYGWLREDVPLAHKATSSPIDLNDLSKGIEPNYIQATGKKLRTMD